MELTDIRIKEITEFLEDNQAAIITAENNRFYFTAMRSSAGVVIITKNQSYLLIDFRYYEKAKSVAKNVKVILCERLFEQLRDILNRHEINTLLLEAESVTISDFERYKSR